MKKQITKAKESFISFCNELFIPTFIDKGFRSIHEEELFDKRVEKVISWCKTVRNDNQFNNIYFYYTNYIKPFSKNNREGYIYNQCLKCYDALEKVQNDFIVIKKRESKIIFHN